MSDHDNPAGHVRWETVRQRLEAKAAAAEMNEIPEDTAQALHEANTATHLAEIRKRHDLTPAYSVEEAYTALINYVLDSKHGIPDHDANDLALIIARYAADNGHHTPLEQVLTEFGITRANLEQATPEVDDYAAALTEDVITEVQEGVAEAEHGETTFLGSFSQYADAAEPANWLLWSTKHNKWWKPSGWGYTDNRAEAGRFTTTEAMAYYSRSAAGWDPTSSDLRQPTTFPVPEL